MNKLKNGVFMGILAFVDWTVSSDRRGRKIWDLQETSPSHIISAAQG